MSAFVKLFRRVGIGLLLLVPAVWVSAQVTTENVMIRAQNAGLVTPVNQTQTSGDTASVTLDWAYADPLRLAVGFTTRGIHPRLVSAAINQGVQLTDADGNLFSYAYAYPDMQATVDETHMTIVYYPQAYNLTSSQILDDYFTTNFESVPSEVGLQFRLPFNERVLQEWEVPSEGDPTFPYNVGDTVPSMGEFVFDFTIPVQQQIVIESETQTTHNNLDLSLETVRITPTATEAEVCVELPDARDWHPIASIQAGDAVERATAWGTLTRPTAEDTTRCFELVFDRLTDLNTADDLTLSVDSLEQSMPEGTEEWEAISELLAPLGYEFDVILERGENGGGGLRLEPPEIFGMPGFQEAVRDARRELGNIIDGPWVFEVNIE